MKEFRSANRIVLGIVLIISFSTFGCARVSLEKRSIAAPYAAESAGLSPEMSEDFARNCGAQWGMPEKTLNFGRTFYIDHGGYVMEYSGVRKIPLWVSHFVTSEQLETTFTGQYRRPGWKVEASIPDSFRVHDSDYPAGGKPYNRGHMAPNADFGSKAGRDNTFFLSNAVPQEWHNNQQIWGNLEDMIRIWIEERGEAYIITGSLLYDPTDDPQSADYNPQLSDGIVDFEVMGDDQVTVPTHMFKIILAPKSRNSDEWESIAIVLQNKKYDKGGDGTFDDDLEKGIESIDWIEARAGLNFLSELPEGSPEERSLESPKASHLWAH